MRREQRYISRGGAAPPILLVTGEDCANLVGRGGCGGTWFNSRWWLWWALLGLLALAPVLLHFLHQRLFLPGAADGPAPPSGDSPFHVVIATFQFQGAGARRECFQIASNTTLLLQHGRWH